MNRNQKRDKKKRKREEARQRYAALPTVDLTPSEHAERRALLLSKLARDSARNRDLAANSPRWAGGDDVAFAEFVATVNGSAVWESGTAEQLQTLLACTQRPFKLFVVDESTFRQHRRQLRLREGLSVFVSSLFARGALPLGERLSLSK